MHEMVREKAMESFWKEKNVMLLGFGFFTFSSDSLVEDKDQLLEKR